MFVYHAGLKKYVKVNAPAKPIGNGKNAGTCRSMKSGTNIQRLFQSKVGTRTIFHKFTV